MRDHPGQDFYVHDWFDASDRAQQLQDQCLKARDAIGLAGSKGGWMDVGLTIGRYLESGIRPGSFTYALLEGDLFKAAALADLSNRRHLGEIARVVLDNLPTACYGSPEVVAKWIARFKVNHDTAT